jgi:hypothetical protein
VTSLRAERAQVESERRRGRARIGIAVAVVLVAVVALVLLAGGRPVPPGRGAYDAGTTDAVTAALPALSGFAESQRGLRYRTPPRVQVVDATTYAKIVTEPITTPDGTPIGDRAATRRALALGHLRTETDRLPEAFYSFQRHAVFLHQGRPFDAFARVVLVHELTHALQDQWFDLLALARATAGDADRSRALAAVIEGDATRVELAYLATRPAADQAAVKARYDYDPTPRSYAELDRTFPYTVGRDFVTALANQGGNAAVDTAFRHPPASTAQVIDPRDYTGGVEPLGVRAPAAEGQRLDAGTLGQFGWAALVTRGTRVVNVSATSGWLGDSYVTFRSARGLCTYANVVVTDTEQREQLVRDLAGWLSTRRGRAVVERSGERGVRLRSCA